MKSDPLCCALDYATFRVFDTVPTLTPTSDAIARMDFLSFLSSIIFAVIVSLVTFLRLRGLPSDFARSRPECPLSNHLTFPRTEDSHELEHHLTHRGRGIESLTD